MYKLTTKVKENHLVNDGKKFAVETFKSLFEVNKMFDAYVNFLPGLVFAQIEDANNKILNFYERII